MEVAVEVEKDAEHSPGVENPAAGSGARRGVDQDGTEPTAGETWETVELRGLVAAPLTPAHAPG